MGIKADGSGSVIFKITQTVLVPEHDMPPQYIPGEPTPPVVTVPEMICATFEPVNDPESTAIVNGSFTVSTEDIEAFAVGDTYTLDFIKNPKAVTAAPAAKKGK